MGDKRQVTRDERQETGDKKRGKKGVRGVSRRMGVIERRSGGERRKQVEDKEFGERGRETVGNRKTHGSKGDGQMRRGDEEDWGRERGVQEENRE